jgi:hypothetical protein
VDAFDADPSLAAVDPFFEPTHRVEIVRHITAAGVSIPDAMNNIHEKNHRQIPCFLAGLHLPRRL